MEPQNILVKCPCGNPAKIGVPKKICWTCYFIMSGKAILPTADEDIERAKKYRNEEIQEKHAFVGSVA